MLDDDARMIFEPRVHLRLKSIEFRFPIARLMMVLSASAAFAGEAKGPPGPGGATGGLTPIGEGDPGDLAQSACAFSGLNDVIDAAEPIQVQSYGQFIKLFGKDFVDTEIGAPGVSCRGFPSFPAP